MKIVEVNKLFSKVIDDYHILNDVNQRFVNPVSSSDTLHHLLYKKCWIDTVQWHYEDLIRDPDIEPASGMQLKRRIDASNQERTDIVEQIDDYFRAAFKDVQIQQAATLNTESPAWALDRLSILALKIYHMREESLRNDASAAHQKQCAQKLAILLEQQKDLCAAIEQLLEDIAAGRKYMKVYKQMKMYNDLELNPILRAKN